MVCAGGESALQGVTKVGVGQEQRWGAVLLHGVQRNGEYGRHSEGNASLSCGTGADEFVGVQCVMMMCGVGV